MEQAPAEIIIEEPDESLAKAEPVLEEPVKIVAVEPAVEKPKEIAPVVEAKVNKTLFNAFFMDAELGEGIYFTVQIAAAVSPMSEREFKNVSSVYVYVYQGELYRYFTSVHKDYKSASADLSRTRSEINPGAFITAYKDGKRIPIGEAK